MVSKKRLDQMLRQWSLAPSRTKAQELISSGAVEVFEREAWKTVTDEAHLVVEGSPELVRLKPNPVLDYVSRGGRKLEGALRHLNLDVGGMRAIDIGISTGGFTDCLLKKGAAKVLGVDVGHEQLAEPLKKEPRLTSIEGVNAREMRRDERVAPHLEAPWDLVVVDVSFISLTQVLDEALAPLRPGGHLLALVKPQFEVSRSQLNKKGVVTDLELHAQVRDKVESAVRALGLIELQFFECELRGQDGNQEYFIYARKPIDRHTSS